MMNDIRREYAARQSRLQPLKPAIASLAKPDQLLIYWPSGGDNPYFRLLYGRLSSHGWQASGLHPEAIFDHRSLPVASSPVLHIHWSQSITHHIESPEVRLERALATIDHVTAAGGGLILSVHEPLPHEYQDRNLEITVKRELVARAQIVHFLHPSTVEQARALYPVPEEKVRVVEMPLFGAAYPPPPGHKQSRADLRLPDDAFVVAMVGNLKPWKGLDRLLDAVDEGHRAGLDVHTIVAGRPTDASDALRRSTARAETTRCCRAYFHSVSDHEFGTIVQAADLVVAPYDVMHNSGVIFAAISVGTVVLAPDTPVTRSAADSGLVELYDARDPDGFTNALLELARSRAPRRTIDPAFERAHDPVLLADRFASLVNETFG